MATKKKSKKKLDSLEMKWDRSRADLHVALDEIEGRNGHMSEAAAQDPPGGACGVECRRIHLDLSTLARRRNDEGLGCSFSFSFSFPSSSIRNGRTFVEKLLQIWGFGTRRRIVEERRDKGLTTAL